MTHELSVILASFGEADRIAASASRWLAVSPCLTEAEQTLYGETIAEQERAHGDVSLAWARTHGWTPARGITPHAALAQRDCLMIAHLPEPLRTAHTLATLRVVELQAVRWFTALAKLFNRSSDTRMMAGDYGQIARDERMHTETNLGIVHRLSEDPGFRRMEQRAFQLARSVYAPLVLENVVRT